jgi:putative ubiquitin-RnfH superfamily antitoxin RatB of RatAB toxin-antitoxin module
MGSLDFKWVKRLERSDARAELEGRGLMKLINDIDLENNRVGIHDLFYKYFIFYIRSNNTI